MTRVAFAGVTLTLLILTLCLFPPILTSGDLGLCLPSPNEWRLPHFAGWVINTLLIILSVGILAAANKKFNFIPEANSILTLGLPMLLAFNCLTTATITTSTLLLLCNVCTLFVIFSTYEENNAAKEFFIIGTLPAIGAMFQYSFLTMIPIYIAGGLLMKSFRLREFIAFLFGLIAPYWIVIGLGIVSLPSFRLPESLMVFATQAVEHDIFYSVLASGITAFLSLILALYNGVRLFSRNSRLRCMHMTINFMGFGALMAIIFDFNNFAAYFGTLSLWLSVELAALLHLYHIRQSKIAMLLLLVVFLPLYILSL